MGKFGGRGGSFYSSVAWYLCLLKVIAIHPGVDDVGRLISESKIL